MMYIKYDNQMYMYCHKCPTKNILNEINIFKERKKMEHPNVPIAIKIDIKNIHQIGCNDIEEKYCDKCKKTSDHTVYFENINVSYICRSCNSLTALHLQQ
jgi:hypothetical protein